MVENVHLLFTLEGLVIISDICLCENFQEWPIHLLPHQKMQSLFSDFFYLYLLPHLNVWIIFLETTKSTFYGLRAITLYILFCSNVIFYVRNLKMYQFLDFEVRQVFFFNFISNE